MIMLRLGSAIGSLAMFVAVVSAAIAQSEDLLIYHRFDGNLKDSSGNGFDGEFFGDAELVDNEGAPIPGGDGAMSSIKKAGNLMGCGASPDLLIPDNLTIMAWINVDEANSVQFIAGTPYEDENRWQAPWVAYQLGVRSGNMTTFIGIDGADREFQTPSVVPGEWTHLAFSFSGEGVIAYINGEEADNKPDRIGEITYNGEPHFVVGERHHSAFGEPTGGFIDEVALFTRVLDEEEIATVMAEGIALPVSPAGRLATTWAHIKR